MIGIVVFLVAIHGAAPQGAADDGLALLPPTEFDRWYVISIHDQPAGWMHSSRVQATDITKHITSHQEMQLSIRRGAEDIRLRIAGTFVETSDGEPVSLWMLEELGSTPKETTYRFETDHIVIEYPGQAIANSTMPLPKGKYLTPVEFDAYRVKRLRSTVATGDIITARWIDPLSGIVPVEMEYKIIDREYKKADRNGQVIQGIELHVSQREHEGATSKEVVNDAGQPLWITTSIGSFDLEIAPSTKLDSQQPVRAAEILVSTFIKPNRRIRRPRGVRRAVYELHVKEGDVSPFPSVGYQSVEWLELPHEEDPPRNMMRVAIDLNGDIKNATADELKARDTFLQSSMYVNANAATVQTLAARAVQTVRERSSESSESVSRRRAEAMRVFVNRYVKHKDLGVGFASAREVAESRQGDCTEHAVLLCAMLRAQDIPARVATGLLYAESFAGESHIFGFHMWTQALIEGKWIDLDSTLRRPFDATHITIETSALAGESATNAFSRITPLFGRLVVKVLETQ